MKFLTPAQDKALANAVIVFAITYMGTRIAILIAYMWLAVVYADLKPIPAVDWAALALNYVIALLFSRMAYALKLRWITAAQQTNENRKMVQVSTNDVDKPDSVNPS